MIFAAAISGCKKGEEAPAAQSANAPKAVETAQASQAPKADVLKETQDELINEARTNFQPIPLDVKEGYKQLKNNNPTPEKLELGKMLYFEPRLSKSQLISCNTCHNLSFGGDDYQQTSIGHGWQRGPRNAPTVLNSVYNTAQFWDGRAGDLKEQAKGPLQASVEMAATPEYVVEVVKSIPEYVELFKVAFPGEADPVTFDNVAKAIEVFEATLLTPNSKFDQFLRGDSNALNADEKAGLKLYMDNGCTSCHAGINLTSDGYHPFGLKETPEEKLLAGDKGRFVVSEAEGDEFAFKAPTLRNIEYTAPYFHSGLVWDLNEAVAIMAKSQLGADLSAEEVAQIVAFLKSTTGEMPKVEYPILPPSTNNTPKPTYTID
ncbi:MAG TPA: cytochrome-c peroxidase [Candidatus Mucispirillum faecigallinarum]|uniref:Cytochrome-c peroxidase n=1 Tax=Candidatus Mucispirillum faecigallinarum TaxID=2838699 RepID=A0A9D2GTM0_9BACT|nr:cytochrome-c peroxidase [Candidatus Mucispirillum faecigallinarum]